MSDTTTIPMLALAPVRWNALPPPSRRALTQFATTRPVFVLEPAEPIETGDREFWELSCCGRDLLVCRPRVANVHAFEQPEEQVRMTRSLLRWLDIDAFVALLYTPAEELVARALAPALVIHDRGFEPARVRATPPRTRTATNPLAAAEISGTV
jgi:hypothetical protein